ncbi:MAG: two component LuxR family transcriptional regulator [Bacteroidetes bacterium]|nr:two component LuxR family transcriptional regulator [Bacteroidota bacterium]
MILKKDSQADSTKELVARHLRAADILVKEGNIVEAVKQIERAIDLDPKNYYARSFLERARAQMERARQKKELEQPEAKDTKAILEDQRIAQISLLLRTADQLIAAKKYKLAQQQVEKVFAINPQNYYAKGYDERIARLLEAEAKKLPGQPAPEKPPAPAPRPAAPEPAMDEWKPGERASVAMYRELLKEMWFDGKVTEVEVRELKKVRDLFRITDAEHKELEKQIQIDAYVEALRIAWRDGALSQNENDVLQIMREKFNITMEEHMSAEAKILWAKNTPDAKSTILLADDEESLLLSLAANLRNHGYDVRTAESVEKALEMLERSIPSIIVSDLLFGEGQETGIEFYQRVRKDPRLNNVPFLLMSGISDEFVVRAGMRLGVDNFIQKPFDLELLLATIEGKLKT